MPMLNFPRYSLTSELTKCNRTVCKPSFYTLNNTTVHPQQLLSHNNGHHRFTQDVTRRLDRLHPRSQKGVQQDQAIFPQAQLRPVTPAPNRPTPPPQTQRPQPQTTTPSTRHQSIQAKDPSPAPPPRRPCWTTTNLASARFQSPQPPAQTRARLTPSAHPRQIPSSCRAKGCCCRATRYGTSR